MIPDYGAEFAAELEKPSRFTEAQIRAAFDYWKNLTPEDLLGFWKHYTTGAGAGGYHSVGPETSFKDYMVESHWQSEYERIHDL